MNKLIYSILAASALAVLPAQAVILVPHPESNGTALDGTAATGVTAEGVTAYQATGYFDGNDKPTAALDLLNGDIFGDLGNWTQFATDGDFNAINGASSGDWTLNTAYTGGKQFALAVKAGNSFSLYHFDNVGNPVDNGTFDTSGVELVGQGNVPGLSHLTLYVSETDSSGGGGGGGGGNGGGGNEVPEPSTYAMFGMAFAMFAFMRYRARSRKS